MKTRQLNIIEKKLSERNIISFIHIIRSGIHKTKIKEQMYLGALLVTHNTLTTKNMHYEVSIKSIFKGIKNCLVE